MRRNRTEIDSAARRGDQNEVATPVDARGTPGDDRPAVVSADLERYLVHLAHCDMPVPMKIELIGALRAIMQSFVDRAFGDDSVQQALLSEDKSGGKDAGSIPPVLDSKAHPTTHERPDLGDAFRQQAEREGRRNRPT